MSRWLLPVVLLAGCPGAKAPPPITDPEDINLEVLDRWVEELVPLVEEAAGRTFDTRPPARMGTRLELEAILEAEAKLIIKRIYRGTPDYVIDQMAAQSRGAAPGVVGKYGIETKAMYLSPDAVAGIAQANKLEPDEVEVAAKLVMAHELVHALQDQKANLLPSFGRQRDDDALEAFSAVTEGHANFVEARVAEALGAQHVRAKLDASQGWSDEKGLEKQGAFGIWFRYGLGKQFVAHHYEAGGHEQVWKLVEAPPATTTMIFHPETYSSELGEVPDYEAVLEGVEEELTEGAWTTLTSYTGERGIREQGQQYDEDELNAVLAQLTSGYGLKAVRQDRQAEVKILDFESEAGPTAMMDLIRGHAAEIKAAPAGGLSLIVNVDEWTRIPGIPALEQVVGIGNNVSLEQRTVYAPVGNKLVIVQTRGFRPGLRMVSAVQLVVGRLE